MKLNYTTSLKTQHFSLRHNSGNVDRIFKILSLLDSAINLQQDFTIFLIAPYMCRYTTLCNTKINNSNIMPY